MTPQDLLSSAIDPALALLARVAAIAPSDRARVEMLAIAGQESDWAARRQNGGPARSFWQFEKGGGVAELFEVTPRQLRAVCGELIIPFDLSTVFEAMAWNDVLAASMARLLLWQDPAPLPDVGQTQQGWDYYYRNWRPGAPHPEVWPARYGMAMTIVNAHPTVPA